jgi:hypothetical protein
VLAEPAAEGYLFSKRMWSCAATASIVTLSAVIWPIMMPARLYLAWNVTRAQIGPDNTKYTGQSV